MASFCASECEIRNGRVVGGTPQRVSQGEEMQRNRYVSWWGYTGMANPGSGSGSVGLGLNSIQGRTKGTDETHQSRVRCTEESKVGSDLKTNWCSLYGTGKCCSAVRPGVGALRWIHLGAGKVRVIEWRSGFS